jgi:hypothetical protein
MDESQNSGGTPNGFGLLTIIYVLIGVIAIYYLYRFLYTSADNKATALVTGKRAADLSPEKLPTIPTPYEGGEYSFSTWIYISSFNKNRNTRKHIFELQGKYFSTLLVGLGAFKNTLMVRTHTQDPTSEGFQDSTAPLPQQNFPDVKAGKPGQAFRMADGFQTGTGTGVTGNDGRGSTQATAPPASTTGASAVPPNAADKIGNLSATKLSSMFSQMAMDDSLLTTPAVCDLPEIDLQRWTMITVVLTGRTIDVYLDGKLSRSCMSHSFYKVDPTGVKPVLTDRGGFDGYIGTTSVANYAMNPDEIYRAYLSGPEGAGSMDFIGWFISLFKGSA